MEKDKVWRKACREYINSNRLCFECSKRGLMSLSSFVAHRTKPNNQVEFWNTRNWIALCAECYHRIMGNQMIAVQPPISADVLPTLHLIK